MTAVLKCNGEFKSYAYIERDAGRVATLDSIRPRRGLLNIRPVFARTVYQVQVMDYGQDDPATPVFAASFFSPIDAKAAVRAAI